VGLLKISQIVLINIILSSLAQKIRNGDCGENPQINIKSLWSIFCAVKITKAFPVFITSMDLNEKPVDGIDFIMR
jgi:hypothetical protein